MAAERTVEVAVLNRHSHEGLFGDFLLDGAHGHNGNAGVNFHRAFDSLDVVKFHHVFHFHTVFLQDFIKRFAGGDIRFETDDFLACEGFELDIFLLSKGMALDGR